MRKRERKRERERGKFECGFTKHRALYTALILDSNDCARVGSVLVIAPQLLHTARVHRGTSVVLTTTATTTTATSVTSTMAVGGRRRGLFEFGLLRLLGRGHAR